MGIHKNKYENIANKNYNNSQINVNMVSSKIWDMVQAIKFKTVKKLAIIDFKIRCKLY